MSEKTDLSKFRDTLAEGFNRLEQARREKEAAALVAEQRKLALLPSPEMMEMLAKAVADIGADLMATNKGNHGFNAFSVRTLAADSARKQDPGFEIEYKQREANGAFHFAPTLRLTFGHDGTAPKVIANKGKTDYRADDSTFFYAQNKHPDVLEPTAEAVSKAIATWVLEAAPHRALDILKASEKLKPPSVG